MDRQDSDHESDYKQSEAEYQLLQVIRKYLKCSAPRQFKNLLEINGHSSTCTVKTATVTDGNRKSCTCCHGALTFDHATTLVNTFIFVRDTTAKLQKSFDSIPCLVTVKA